MVKMTQDWGETDFLQITGVYGKEAHELLANKVLFGEAFIDMTAGKVNKDLSILLTFNQKQIDLMQGQIG